MSVDTLQEKIRKTKNPSVLELQAVPGDVPPRLLEEAGSVSAACGKFCRELLEALKGTVPAVRVSFSSFALLGWEGMKELTEVLKAASAQGYYVLLDAPELLSPDSARMTAEALLGNEAAFPCDGVLISGFLGSDVLKPFLPYCGEGKKDVFVAVRTANKSAPELQDLLAGSRVVHIAAADHVNRYGADMAGKYGYTRVGLMAAASSPESLRTLRSKYPKLFLLLDGYDYPNSNAKNCSFAFDKFGHGAAACAGRSITGAWKEGESGEDDFRTAALEAAKRMKKNIGRYITVL